MNKIAKRMKRGKAMRKNRQGQETDEEAFDSSSSFLENKVSLDGAELSQLQKVGAAGWRAGRAGACCNYVM